MNLKESFRYQSFLTEIMRVASMNIMNPEHCLRVTKTHKKNNANSEVEDVTEEVNSESEFYANDDVIALMEYLIDEKEKLSIAINSAKNVIGFDIDAGIEANKFRQLLHRSIRRMFEQKPYKKNEKGMDYKFNVEGNQTPYYYNIEVTAREAYDKEQAQAVMRNTISEADRISAKIDAATVNTQVEYEPRFDVNASFEEVMDEFLQNNKPA